MRIGINAIMFQKENKTGIPTAVENVLRSWSEKHPENEYYLFARKSFSSTSHSEKTGIRYGLRSERMPSFPSVRDCSPSDSACFTVSCFCHFL